MHPDEKKNYEAVVEAAPKVEDSEMWYALAYFACKFVRWAEAQGEQTEKAENVRRLERQLAQSMRSLHANG